MTSFLNLLQFVTLTMLLTGLGACSDSGPPTQLLDYEDIHTSTGIKSVVSKEGHQVYQFGFDLRSSPEEDARQYLPLLHYLEGKTGLQFRLRFVPRDRRIAELLGTGELGFAAVGLVSYLRAHEYGGARILVRGLSSADKASYQSALVTATNSIIPNVRGLQNKLVAFGSMDSTQGHLIPRLMLREHGLRLADLKGHQYTGSHQACADAVISGRFDACGMQDVLAKRLQDEGVLRILALSRPYPSSGIAAAARIPDDIRRLVREALVDFQPTGRDRPGLYHWERTEMAHGFVAANESDYDRAREEMYELGMLHKSVKQDNTPHQ